MDVYLRLLRYAKPYKWHLVGAALCMSLSAALNVGALFQLGPIFDKIFSGHSSPGVLAASLRLYPPLIVALIGAKGLTSYIGNVLNGMASNSITADVREEIYGKLLDLPLAFHSENQAGQLMSRVTNDINLMPGGIGDVLGRVFGAGCNIVGIVAGVFWINWRLALILVVAFPACVGPLVNFSRRLRRHSDDAQDRMAELTAHLHETLAGVRVIIGFGTSGEERARFGAMVRGHYRALLRQIRASAASSPVMEFIFAIAGAALVVVAGRMINAHTLTTGQLIVVVGLLGSIYPQLKSINSVNVGVQGALAGSARVFKVLDEPLRLVEKADAVEPRGFEDSVRFEGVSFAYREGHPVLEGISLEIAKGSTVALVGPSGGGKTTLADLVPRFHDPVSGRVTLDGRDLRDLKLKSLRALVGVVTQETFLFNDTIANNIRYGRASATDEEVREAARVANAHGFIEEQPEGYATRIGDRGVRLSGGQRQRLSIARAVLRNPPLLILDEATSALDTESERLVQQALERLMRNRTSLVIAHRLSTVRHADLIVVLDRGRIVDRGCHDELVAKDGLYARLCRMQFVGLEEPAAAQGAPA